MRKKRGQRVDMTYFPLVQVRTEESLSVDTLAVIRAITLDANFPSKIVGSFQYAIHEYPGDIDLMEEYVGCCSVASTARAVADGIRQIIKNVRKRKLTFLGDFKAGVDARYKVDIGEFVLSGKNLVLKGYDAAYIRASIAVLKNTGMLAAEEENELLRLVRDAPNYMEHHELFEAVRKYYVLRWTIDELESGYKILRGHVKISLRDAVAMNTVVKIDIYAFINGRFVEVTNWFLLKMRSHTGSKLRTISERMGNYETNILKDIALYKNPDMRKHMKLAKRLWLHAVHKKDELTMKKLFPLFSSGAAKLSQIVSDLETLCNMLKKLRYPPLKFMLRELQDMKMRMATIMADTLPIKTATKVFRIINSITFRTNAADMLERLDEIGDILNDCVNLAARKYLLKAKLI
jgi:hypothetical protein